MSQTSYNLILRSLKEGDLVEIISGPFQGEGQIQFVDKDNNSVGVWIEYVDQYCYADFVVIFSNDGLYQVKPVMRQYLPIFEAMKEKVDSAYQLLQETGALESSFLDSLAEDLEAVNSKLHTLIADNT